MRFLRSLSQVPGFLGNSPRFVVTLLALALVAVLAWLLGPGAKWVLTTLDDVDVTKLDPKDLTTAVDAVRGRVLTVATGLVALVAVYYTARNAATARRTLELSEQNYRSTVEMSDRTYRLSEQGHVTDRYTKAIEQLGSDKRDIRLGGIYALERIARDSARDRPTIMDVLAAFIREHSHDDKAEESSTAKSPATDIRAALTVIGRRDIPDDEPVRRIDLAGADLSRANLRRANLSHVNLYRTNLYRADLYRADLTGAYLRRADLRRADLTRANLTGANLTDTDLTDTDLTGVIGLSVEWRQVSPEEPQP
ncbi:pentapeptide repeat-containing protein [Streptosporangium sp. 'caverna']|uniref:pentapeptide repeat-containing protein n=1 Tax=Streptosporangium sp. 'caverna' TaxID=2202249 RepID=UPI0013A6CA94|nr:pentapeptide repeat-containing protein [Streptosporangium sp. 'caverna']